LTQPELPEKKEVKDEIKRERSRSRKKKKKDKIKKGAAVRFPGGEKGEKRNRVREASGIDMAST